MGRKPKMVSYDWETDKFVTSWLEGIKKKDDYKREFNVFFEWLKERHPELDTPTKLIEKRLADLKSDDPRQREFFESEVVSFKTHLEKRNLKESTVKTFLRSVRSFFSRNRLPLKFKRGELKVEESLEVRMNHRPKWIIGNEEVRVVYSMARVEDRVLLLTLYHTGLSPIDVCQLRIENFQNSAGHSKFYDEQGNWIGKGHIYFEKQREKTNVWQKTCLSEEAVHDIGLVLKKRGYPKKGYLLKTQKNRRLSVRYVNERLKLLVAEALGEEYGKQFQGSDLRDTYNDALLRANLKEEIKDVMFGHKRAGARAKYYVSEATIREAYEKVFPYLTINSVRRSREEFQQLKETIVNQQKEVEDLKTRTTILTEKISDYESQIVKLFDAVTNQTKLFEELQKQTRKLEEQTKRLEKLTEGLK